MVAGRGYEGKRVYFYLLYLYLKILRYKIPEYVCKLIEIIKLKRIIDDAGKRG